MYLCSPDISFTDIHITVLYRVTAPSDAHLRPSQIFDQELLLIPILHSEPKYIKVKWHN